MDTFNVPNLPFSQARRNEIFSKTSSQVYRELCGPEGVVLQQNNTLQQVIQEVRHDSNIHGTISEQQETIGQIINEIYRLRDELAKMKLTLKQGFILIDETCAQHASVLRVYSPLQELKLEQIRGYMKCCNVCRIKWEFFSFQGGGQIVGQDRMIAQLSQQVQALSQSPLWHEMQKTAVEIQQLRM